MLLESSEENQSQKVIIPFETGSNTPPVNIDCTGITNSVMEAFQQSNKEEPDKMNKTISSQQEQLDRVLATMENLMKASNKDLNTPLVQPTIETHNYTPDHQNTVSIAGFDRWFNSVGGGKTSTVASSSTSHSKNKENLGEVEVLEKDQEYWHDATTNDYEEENTANGEEITSSIASASKVFWYKPLKQESLKMKLTKAATPVNCKFLLPKRTNKEIWSNMPTYARSTDVKLQKIQKCHSASVTMTLHAASKLTVASKDTLEK